MGGLDLDSRSSGCARLGGEVGPPLGVVVEEVAFCVSAPNTRGGTATTMHGADVDSCAASHPFPQESRAPPAALAFHFHGSSDGHGFLASLSAADAASADEDAKKAKRLERNRESARNSRMRKKQHLKLLEDKVKWTSSAQVLSEKNEHAELLKPQTGESRPSVAWLY